MNIAIAGGVILQWQSWSFKTRPANILTAAEKLSCLCLHYICIFGQQLLRDNVNVVIWLINLSIKWLIIDIVSARWGKKKGKILLSNEVPQVMITAANRFLVHWSVWSQFWTSALENMLFKKYQCQRSIGLLQHQV